MENARPGNQCPNSVEAKSPDENRLVAIVSEDPVRMTKRSKGISAGYQVSNGLPQQLAKSEYPRTQNKPPEVQMNEPL